MYGSFTGEIFSGDLDQSNEMFYLTGVKSLGTGSELSIEQLVQLREYILNQKDSFMLTVNDQIPILLQNEEIESLLNDISNIISMLKH